MISGHEPCSWWRSPRTFNSSSPTCLIDSVVIACWYVLWTDGNVHQGDAGGTECVGDHGLQHAADAEVPQQQLRYHTHASTCPRRMRMIIITAPTSRERQWEQAERRAWGV